MAAICFWVALWAAVASFVGNDLLLAGPLATVESLGAMLVTPGFWAAVALSGFRIVASSIVSALAGIVLGLLAARFRWLEVLFETPIQVMKSAPVACVVVILLVAFGSVGAIVFIVAFVALPPFYVASLQAAQTKLGDQVRALRLMGLPKPALFFACTWPAILPLYKQAAKTAVALSWRAGITGELLSIPLGSMGAAIYSSKLTLDTSALLAWTGVVMLLAFLCELVTVGVLDLTAASPRIALRMHHNEGRRRPCTHGGTEGAGAVHEATRCEGAASAESILRLDEVSRAYGEKHVLESISLALAPSEHVCLMAPTGAGKTTLLRIALGMEPADAGRSFRPSSAGVVLQQPTLIGSLSAWDNVLLVADSCRAQDDMRSQMKDLLPKGTLDKDADSLSGGTKRLTEMARALFSPGECIVLDEPFAGLDPDARERACAFVLRNVGDRPLIIATHEKDDAGLLDATILTL